MNKRATKHLENRKNELVRSLELNQTCLALTNGLCDDEFFESDQNDKKELNEILGKLNLKNVKIGQSHKIWRMKI